MRRLFSSVFPEHKWETWRFGSTTPQFWSDLGSPETRAALISLIETIAKKHNISQGNLAKWYSISYKKLGSGVQKALRQAGGFINALRLAYPNHDWNPKLFMSATTSGRKESVQQRLHSLILEHFNGSGSSSLYSYNFLKLNIVWHAQPFINDL